MVGNRESRRPTAGPRPTRPRTRKPTLTARRPLRLWPPLWATVPPRLVGNGWPMHPSVAHIPQTHRPSDPQTLRRAEKRSVRRTDLSDDGRAAAGPSPVPHRKTTTHGKDSGGSVTR